MVGIGAAVVQTLQYDLAYENLFYEDKNMKAGRSGIKTGPGNRGILLDCLGNRLINGGIRINSRRLVHELKTFKYNAQYKKAQAQT